VILVLSQVPQQRQQPLVCKACSSLTLQAQSLLARKRQLGKDS
jgi:hypothetical protein